MEGNGLSHPEGSSAMRKHMLINLSLEFFFCRALDLSHIVHRRRRSRIASPGNPPPHRAEVIRNTTIPLHVNMQQGPS